MSGSVVASPVLAAYDPDPDYFFHWYRDSAVVMDALRLLLSESSWQAEALAQFGAFVHFSLSLQTSMAALSSPAPGARVAADFEHFLRTDEDLARAHGERSVARRESMPMARWISPSGRDRSTMGPHCAR